MSEPEVRKTGIMMSVRPAALADLPGILAIYNAVIATSTTVYMDDPVTLANRREWFEGRVKAGYPVLVAAEGSAILGFSSFGDFRAFPGYRFTVEHSVHIADGQRGKGLGRQLVQALIPLAKQRGKHVILGGIDAENAGSIRFHEKLGFTEVAHMPQVGFKFGRWLDLVFMQKILSQ